MVRYIMRPQQEMKFGGQIQVKHTHTMVYIIIGDKNFKTSQVDISLLQCMCVINTITGVEGTMLTFTV